MRTLLLLAVLFLPLSALAERTTVTLWHSYRAGGGEEAALAQSIVLFEAMEPDIHVEAVANPYDNFASKLTTTVPNGAGPDLFVFAHERLGGWARTGIVAALDGLVPPEAWEEFLPETLAPLTFEKRRWGLPLGFKSVALFYNRALVRAPPRTTDELLAAARQARHGETYGLAYEADSLYFHAPWLYGFGGSVLPTPETSGLDTREAVASYAFVSRLVDAGVMPKESSGALVTRLFNEGKLAMTVSGPWFLSEIAPNLEFGVAPLPVVSETGLAAKPFLTDEAIFLSGEARARDAAVKFARFLAGRSSAVLRAQVGRQVVANALAWEDERLSSDAVLGAFRAQLSSAVPMPNGPEMRNLWEPAKLGLKKLLRGRASPEEAATAASRRFHAIARRAPAEADARPYAILVSCALIVLATIAGRAGWRALRGQRPGDVLTGWSWIGPGMATTTVLVFVPFAMGLGLAFFDHHEGSYTFVGFANFADILLARRFPAAEPLSFYYALVVTLAWTVTNVALHISIGLGLALLLNRAELAGKGLYRVLLVLPWAVPNYITALLWKGLFDWEFGAVNGLLELVGLDRVAWFSSVWTAFVANLCTNAWLGFPFMMVVSLGALQAIPRELYEAADVDGASRWMTFRHVTLPLLRPALVPALLLGMVWTFNAFNVVYLVSGGEPDNATDILVSEAYRWAFARQEQYGYAAAYAALIFLILLGWSIYARRLARRAEESAR